ncbi:putative methionyl-tRNA synthetase [Hordeum vulgare]|nr:putative methionyl-tRNA synthetase [Hordeum vulgare]
MVWMFGMYRQDNSDQEFKFLHVFSKIESCEKWRKVRLALTKAKETYNLDTPTPTVAEGRPDGTRKARAASDVAPAVVLLQSSIKQCIADAKNSTAKRVDKSNARWLVLMMKQDIRLDLLRNNVIAKKRNIDLAFLMGEDMLTMDEQVKAWFLVERSLILNQMPAPVASTAVTMTATPTTTPSPSTEPTPTMSSTM